MIRKNIMYLRPGNLYKTFIIENNKNIVSSVGRPKVTYSHTQQDMLEGILAEADPNQKMRWEQLQHPITHTIVQDGKPKVKAEDKLILENRIFLVQGVDDLGSLGIFTIYYVEERYDVK